MKVELVEYTSGWPHLYEREAERIRGLLGARVRIIEHVGSTSVPGLAAKPVIDIVVGVPDSSDEDAYLPALESGGYRLRLREPEWFEHRLFSGPDAAINLHVFSEGCQEIDDMIRFRDRLRENPTLREEYLRVKRDLADREWSSVQDYADAKTEIVLAIRDGSDWSE